MESESSDASHLPWIWFLECLASNNQVDYLTLRDVTRKVPGLSGSAAMQARELLALRCLEGLAEVGSEASGPAGCGSKIGLDLSQMCSAVLYNLTSEALKSNLDLDGLGMAKWDIKTFVEHKRTLVPKCTLERLEEMIVEGKDPAAVSLREISGVKNYVCSEDMFVDEGAAKIVSFSCDETSHYDVAACMQQVRESIPENEEGLCQDRNKDVLLPNALIGKGNNLKRNGDAHSNIEKSIKDMQVGDKRKHIDAHTGDIGTDQCQVTSPLKEDGPDNGKEPLDNDIAVEQFLEKSGCRDHVHSLQDNQKQSSGASPAHITQTNIGEDIREEITLSADIEPPVTSNCNQQQALVDDQPNNTTCDRSPNCGKGPVSESVVETSRYDLENKRNPSNVGDDSFRVTGYDNEDVDIDAASLKNNFTSSQCTAFDWNGPAVCMKCKRSGTLLCCGASVCSVAVHRDCLGVEPYFDDSGSFRCPFCASSLANAQYLEAKGRASIRKRELEMYLSSSLSNKLPRRMLNTKKRRNSKQVDMSSPMKDYDDEDRDTQPNLNGKHMDNISPVINGHADVSSTPASHSAGMSSDLPVREINIKATGNGIQVERPILHVKDILPSNGKTKTTDSTTCQTHQPPLASEEFEHDNSRAIILYVGNIECDKKDTTGRNRPESKIKRVRAARNIPSIMISNPTSNVPYQSYPAYRRRKVPWTEEEENKLREGVEKFHNPEGSVIPWSQILEFGALVFHPCRTAENLKDKWRNICKKDKM